MNPFARLRLPALFRRSPPATLTNAPAVSDTPVKGHLMSDTSAELMPTALDFLTKMADTLQAERKARKVAEMQIAVLMGREAVMKQLMTDVLRAHEDDGGVVTPPVALTAPTVGDGAGGIAAPMPAALPGVTYTVHLPDAAPVGLEMALHPPVGVPTVESVIPTPPVVAAPTVLPVGANADGMVG